MEVEVCTLADAAEGVLCQARASKYATTNRTTPIRRSCRISACKICAVWHRHVDGTVTSSPPATLVYHSGVCMTLYVYGRAHHHTTGTSSAATSWGHAQSPCTTPPPAAMRWPPPTAVHTTAASHAALLSSKTCTGGRRAQMPSETVSWKTYAGLL